MDYFNNINFEFKKFADDLFSSNGFECKKIYDGSDVYYCGRDILLCLGYDDDDHVISRILEKIKYKYTIDSLKEGFDIYIPDFVYQKFIDVNKEVIDFLDNNDKDCIFIDKVGLDFLIKNSNKEMVKPFKDFVYGTLLPKLYNFHTEFIEKKVVEEKEAERKVVEEKEAEKKVVENIVETTEAEGKEAEEKVVEKILETEETVETVETTEAEEKTESKELAKIMEKLNIKRDSYFNFILNLYKPHFFYNIK